MFANCASYFRIRVVLWIFFIWVIVKDLYFFNRISYLFWALYLLIFYVSYVFKLSAKLGKFCSFICRHIFWIVVRAQVWANVHLQKSAPGNIIIIENCQCYLCFSIEPLIGGTSTLPWLWSGSMEEPAVFASVKMNKSHAVQGSPFLESFIYIAPNSVV